jgi:hypothetical protein
MEAQVFGTEFLIDGNALSLVASDANCNFYTFAYDRNNWQGQKLLTCAAFHLGAKVTKFVRRRPQPASGTVIRTLPWLSLVSVVTSALALPCLCCHLRLTPSDAGLSTGYRRDGIHTTQSWPQRKPPRAPPPSSAPPAARSAA